MELTSHFAKHAECNTLSIKNLFFQNNVNPCLGHTLKSLFLCYKVHCCIYLHSPSMFCLFPLSFCKDKTVVYPSRWREVGRNRPWNEPELLNLCSVFKATVTQCSVQKDEARLQDRSTANGHSGCFHMFAESSWVGPGTCVRAGTGLSATVLPGADCGLV